MAKKTPRPIVFPLSNPTERAEARAEDLIRWTEGRALVALAVGLEAQRAGLAPPTTAEELRSRVVASQWKPAYEGDQTGLRRDADPGSR